MAVFVYFGGFFPVEGEIIEVGYFQQQSYELEILTPWSLKFANLNVDCSSPEETANVSFFSLQRAFLKGSLSQ